MERGDRIKVRGFSGVACTYLGPGKRWEPTMIFVENDEGEECEIEDPYGEGEWVDDDSRARVRMVGDDHVYTVDPDDCSPLTAGYCLECGQIGCNAVPSDDDAP